MSSKNEVYTIFLRLKTHVEKFFERHIKVVQSNWDDEYRKLSNIFARGDRSSPLLSPIREQNGTAMIMTLLQQFTLYIISRQLAHKCFTYKKLFKKVPDNHIVKVFDMERLTL